MARVLRKDGDSAIADMSLRATLVILVVAVVLALCHALPIEENNPPVDYGSLDNFFYLSPRLL
ncbi:hypothetical protein NECAME_07926 [Necator americanus]|uniref:Uncharacterized protein n=1 Tax=Necator americanus TaxID=51031 RepID=W2TMX1_NECAM|nr:hypothetical protein NECAME_07926 [Necator americanus]ETN82481.1 hypothetical protein NECAME_07926 [Necator americanus]